MSSKQIVLSAVCACAYFIYLILFYSVVRKKRYRETKHKHLEEDSHEHAFATKESGTAAYDNPVYEGNFSSNSSDTDRIENPLF